MRHAIRDRSFWMGLFGVVVGCLLTEVVRTGPLEDVRADTPSTPEASIEPDGTSQGASHAQTRTVQDRHIPFQAYLTDTDSRPVADASYSIEFKLYESAEGGEAVWWETHNAVPVAKGMVNVLLGTEEWFRDRRGDPPADTALLFDQPRYVGVSVNNDGQEMVPRQQIIPAIHAADSDRAAQLVIPGTFEPSVTVGAEGLVGIGTTEPESTLHLYESSGASRITTQSGSQKVILQAYGAMNAFVGTVTSDRLDLGTGGSTRVIIEPDGDVGIGMAPGSAKLAINGNVGIGTTDPAAKLDVAGETRTTQLDVTSGRISVQNPTLYENIDPELGPYYRLEALDKQTTLYMVRVHQQDVPENFTSYLLLCSSSQDVSTAGLIIGVTDSGYERTPTAAFKVEGHQLWIKPNDSVLGLVDVRVSKIQM